MRLIHPNRSLLLVHRFRDIGQNYLHTEDNLIVVSIFAREAGPKRRKDFVRRTTLADDLLQKYARQKVHLIIQDKANLSIPSRIIVNIDNARSGTSINASLDQGIILSKIRFVDGAAKDIVGQELPANRETEDVKTVILHKMLHLAGAICAVVFREWWPSSTGSAGSSGVTAEVEPRNIDTSKFELPRSWGGSRA